MNRYTYDYRKLRGRIKEKLGTEGEFARRINRSISYVSQVFNNIKQFSQSDILNAVTVLDILPYDIGEYFFTIEVRKNGTDKEGEL